ncbi:MAG TPA: phosphatase PAP2 family protein [Thermoanaerobaculia bacterium]|nr:phosphatase PAP2 family protein [Thermoanaerobaculia bacterium]
MKGSQIGRPYFFEIFTFANLVVLLFVLGNVGPLAIQTMGSVMPPIVVGFLVQALFGIAVRLAFAARRGSTAELLATYRSGGWIADTFRLAIFTGLWVHVYGWIKLTMPMLHPRLFDQELWNLDRAVFFGYSPNLFLLTLFSSSAVLRAIDWSYAYVFFASLNILAIFIASAPDRRMRIAFMNSNTLLWLGGAWLYVAVPALGPAYRFPEVWLPLAPLLPETQHFQRLLIANYSAVLAWLRDVPQPVNILLGVAAFPSLHVGFQTLAFLWMRRQTRWGGTLFGIFVAFIFIGSIVTGWHYLIDGLAGAALAWVSYISAQRVPAIRA